MPNGSPTTAPTSPDGFGSGHDQCALHAFVTREFAGEAGAFLDWGNRAAA